MPRQEAVTYNQCNLSLLESYTSSLSNKLSKAILTCVFMAHPERLEKQNVMNLLGISDLGFTTGIGGGR